MARALLFGSCLTFTTFVACRAAERPADTVLADSAGSSQPVSDLSASLIEARVPRAVAGDPGWEYHQETRADFDGDGTEERAILIANVTLDARGIPMWEHGHRWQVYIEEPDSTRTYAYAAFLPNGKLTADVAEPTSGTPPTIVLLEQTPFSTAAYEIAYRAPGETVVLHRFERALDRTHAFVGSPRP